MSGIRTGDWGALFDGEEEHCWVVIGLGRLQGIAQAMCDTPAIGTSTGFGWSNGVKCERCREIVERAAREVPR